MVRISHWFPSEVEQSCNWTPGGYKWHDARHSSYNGKNPTVTWSNTLNLESFNLLLHQNTDRERSASIPSANCFPVLHFLRYLRVWWSHTHTRTHARTHKHIHPGTAIRPYHSLMIRWSEMKVESWEWTLLSGWWLIGAFPQPSRRRPFPSGPFFHLHIPHLPWLFIKDLFFLSNFWFSPYDWLQAFVNPVLCIGVEIEIRGVVWLEGAGVFTSEMELQQ